jgi:hypothetical protein
MPQYIDAYGFIVTGMALCFVFGFFYAKGKIALNDFPRIIAAAFFCCLLTCLPF